MFIKVKNFFSGLDYRHYICFGITTVFVLLAVFCFPYALPRIWESCKDIGTSAVFYVNELFSLNGSGHVSVTDFSKQPFEMPFNLPNSWEELQVAWGQYWQIWATKENLLAYIDYLGDILYVLSKVILFAMPIVCVLLVVSIFLKGKQNNAHNADTKALRRFKRFERKVCEPIRNWCVGFVQFVKNHSFWFKLWLAIWAYNFNIIAIFLEFIAFYIYFIASFKMVDLYKQLLKLLMDLSVCINFIPTIGWIVIGYFVLNAIRRSIGYKRLEHMERKDRGFINATPIVVMGCGTMGTGKTTQNADFGISLDIMFKDKAFELILQCDLKFPFFPWINLEMAIRKGMEHHNVYNLATCKRLVRSKYLKWVKHPNQQNLFGYNFEKYGLDYDDNLTVTNIWSVIEDYAQLYFIYVIQSSLIISNYAIRTDCVLNDNGNFPLWDTDIFHRDSKMLEAYSRHSHILDFDSLRLGKRIVENNELADSFEFGVINITEIGKERKNALELKELLKKATDTNQKNDLFNDWLKMVRHSATVCNFPFVKVVTDEQRPESWGADARDLCDILYIAERSEMCLAMPLFALSDLVIGFVLSKFEKRYYEHRFNRGDNTLPMYLYHGLMAVINRFHKRIYNTFGFYKLRMQVENGTQDGERQESKYFLMCKKIYAKRFSTDCFSDFFNQKSMRSNYGIDDLPEYETEKATMDELRQQNSYFILDLDEKMRTEKGDKKNE